MAECGPGAGLKRCRASTSRRCFCRCAGSNHGLDHREDQDVGFLGGGRGLGVWVLYPIRLLPGDPRRLLRDWPIGAGLGPLIDSNSLAGS